MVPQNRNLSTYSSKSYRSDSFLLEALRTPPDVHFIIGDWSTKVGSQEIPGVTGKFGL